MKADASITERFEARRPHLRSVAYRMLGSLSDADDAVQESWLRLSRADTSDVENLGGWLTTVVARVCLDMLRSRASRGEDSLYSPLPDPVVGRAGGANPEGEALLVDSVGIALLIVMETLAPDERLAFVLHDVFAVPFDEIAPIVGRTPAAARQLASRARRRVRGQATIPQDDPGRHREVVDAFLAAARKGDFEALVAVLHPDVVLRADRGPESAGLPKVVRGAATVAKQAVTYSRFAPQARSALVNGRAGLVTTLDGRLNSVMAFTVVDGKAVEIFVFADSERLRTLDFTLEE